MILSLAAVMQSSYFDYYHNLMLRRQQPGEHPIIDPAQESLLFRRIVAMSRFIRPVDMQQPGNPLYQLLAADHGALLGKWRQCYRNRLPPQKHTSFFRQQSFKGMAQYAVQCFRWEAAAGIHIPHRTHGRQMAISLHLKVGIRHAVNHA